MVANFDDPTENQHPTFKSAVLTGGEESVLCLQISVTSRNRQSDNNANSTQLLARYAELRRYPRFELLFSELVHLEHTPALAQFTDLHSCPRFSWFRPLTRTFWLFLQLCFKECVNPNVLSPHITLLHCCIQSKSTWQHPGK